MTQKDDSQLIWETYQHPISESSQNEAMHCLTVLERQLPGLIGNIEHYVMAEGKNDKELMDVSRKGHDLLFAVQTYTQNVRSKFSPKK